MAHEGGLTATPVHRPDDLVQRCLGLISRTAPAAYRYWFESGTTETVATIPLQDHADTIYSAYLLGIADRLLPAAAAAFQGMVAGAKLHGRPVGIDLGERTPNAHLTAYLLGACRLLDHSGRAAFDLDLFQGWDLTMLIDQRFLPRWPKAWTHHSWRVSHWIGGVPSILLQIARSGQNSAITPQLVDAVLSNSEQRIINPKTGLLRPYKSEMLQQLFKAAYRLRHDPGIGELGGVVHILWVFHAVGRPYLADQALARNAQRYLERQPFMESVPYCLDFDIIQLARTCHANATPDPALVARAKRYREDVAAFLLAEIPEGYTLHKLPGALATMHECAMIEGSAELPDLQIPAIDIIRDAYWI